MSPDTLMRESSPVLSPADVDDSAVSEPAAVTPSPYFRWKPVVDRTLAALLMLVGGPVTLVLTLLVRLTSKGPGLYRQARVGRNAKVFQMYKIRTMRHDAEAGTGAVWARPGDHRVTRVGKVLRRLHLDEFPQLFNVLRGEMALVGPRPERPEFVDILSMQIPNYANRLTVLPGITGLAQINLPPDVDTESVRRKLVLDLEYIEHATPWLDLRMLLCTLFRLFGFPGATAMRWFRLARAVPLSGHGPCSGDAPRAVESSLGKRSHRPPQTSSQLHHAGGNGANSGNGHGHKTVKAWRGEKPR